MHDRTGGNPFFVVELSRWMVGAHDLHLDSAPVPPSVGEVLRTRLDRLPAGTREVLELAAVAGPGGLAGPARGRRHAGRGGADGAWTPRSPSAWSSRAPGPWSWRFTHALVQEVLVGDLPALRRARLHARLGAALRAAARRPRTTRWSSGSPTTSSRRCRWPGPAPARRYSGRRRRRRPGARLAHGEAAAHTRRALQLLDPAEPDAARTRHDLLTALGNDLLRSGQLHGGAARSSARRSPSPASSTTGDCLAEAAAVWGSVTVWNWRPHGVVDDDMVALLEDLVRRAVAPRTTTR